MGKIFIKKSEYGNFILALNLEETKGIFYKYIDAIDIFDLTLKDLLIYDFDIGLKNGNQLLDDNQLISFLSCYTYIMIKKTVFKN